MKRPPWVFLIAFLALAASVCGSEPGPVYVVPLRTEVSPAQFFFLRRALKEAERHHASAVVIDMDTYGGDVTAAIDAMDALMKTRVPTYTYVDSKALSAGALIALATQKIYLAPAAVIGAAAPVSSTGEDLPKTMGEKATSAMSAMARAAARESGHNPDLADAFVRKDVPVKIGDVLVHAPDSLLTLSSEEAVRQYAGKPLLAEGIASDLEDLLRKAGLTGAVQRVEPLGFERLALWLTVLAPLLLIGGFLGAYIEFKTPGVVAPGIVSAVCFVLFFAGHYVAGLAGWEAAVVFAIGVALVVSELAFHPGTVLPGVAGIVLIFGALVWAMVDHYPGAPYWPSNAMLVRPVATLTVAILVAGVAVYFLAKYLPRTRLFRRFVLEAADPGGPAVAILVSPAAVTPGMLGTSRTMLRPSGKADIGGQVVDVVSHGEFVPSGACVKVIAVEGARVVVETAPGRGV